MPLVQVKCTNCGANLEIDNTLDAAVCPYCNVPFVVEKAINNYNNTTNHINAGSVNAYGGSYFRPEATGYGAVYYLVEVLKHFGDDIKGKTVAACWKSTTARL